MSRSFQRSTEVSPFYLTQVKTPMYCTKEGKCKQNPVYREVCLDAQQNSLRKL